ncbi:PH domain-containing protein [Gulosibacter chungangensis]|uniref:PH domain-containing protein n=1 Tax=Gulosibacter chungangensis TaxID=979746 RepID=A0A7J5B7H2_9MICO|nr:PH domain-containing protein [Gulosibacter chungangensis]KAB1640823.1 PH domain-containing protein [Gulosibacter chungangensis]
MSGTDHPNIQWRRVSMKYATLGVINFAISTLFFIAVAIGLSFIPGGGWWWLFGAIPALLFASQMIFVVIRTKAIGYALRQDDIVYRRGIWWSRMVAVPYGRLQLVDINRGPVERMLGLASLKMVTAAASTGLAIPGLPQAEADQLRDHLIRVAETRRAGL